MSTWSFAADPSQLTTTTFQKAKVWVSRIVGETKDPDKVGAGDAIAAAIDEMNRRRWEYLTVHGSDIALVDVAGTSPGDEGYNGLYTIPTPFKDPLSLIITSGSDSTRTLTYVPRSTWDGMRDGRSIGGTYFYTNFTLGLTGKIQLLDAPTATGTMEIRYYRPITIPGADTDTLDVPPGPIELALKAKAQVWVATWRGLHSERLQMLERRAHLLLNKAYGDEVPTDFTPQLIPGRLWQKRTVNNDAVPRWWEY